jgi:serine/threonine protein kinase
LARVADFSGVVSKGCGRALAVADLATLMMAEAVNEGAGDLFAGTQYRYLERLDAGGMGEVYLVEHRQLFRTFVAKMLHAALVQYPQVVDRMRLEAQALGQLNHPNVVTAAGFGTSADGRPFLVLEHLKGRTLREELAVRGALPTEEAIGHTLALLDGLRAAHALGIVHRDIKPDNLFLATGPSGERVLKILDFGIARVLPTAPAAAPRPLALPTESGAVIGTPRFLSPEGAVGARVDTRADLYAAALMLYTMVAGRGPFDHVSVTSDVMKAHVSEAPALPSLYAPSALPPGLDELLLRALAKDPAERFQTAEMLSSALREVADKAGLTVLPVDAPFSNSARFPETPRSSHAPTAATITHTGFRPSAPPATPPRDQVNPFAPTATAELGMPFAAGQPRRISAPLLALVFLLSAVAAAAAAAGVVTLLVGQR